MVKQKVSAVESSGFDSVLVVIAAVAVVISLFGTGFVYFKNVEYNNWLTGFVTETATVNITVGANVALNFTMDNLTFGSGRVDADAEYAEINTDLGTVNDGDWATKNYGLQIVNIGNVDANISILTGKNATMLFGGYSSALYQYNISDDPEAGSCAGIQSAGRMHVWRDANNTETPVCFNFTNKDTADTLQIDFKFRIPSQTATGPYGDNVTIVYTQAT